MSPQNAATGTRKTPGRKPRPPGEVIRVDGFVWEASGPERQVYELIYREPQGMRRALMKRLMVLGYRVLIGETPTPAEVFAGAAGAPLTLETLPPRPAPAPASQPDPPRRRAPGNLFSAFRGA